MKLYASHLSPVLEKAQWQNTARAGEFPLLKHDEHNKDSERNKQSNYDAT